MPSDLPALLLNNTLSDILKQINVISTRQVQIDNMLVKQQSIDNLTAAVLRHTTTSSVNISPPHTISTPIVRRQELTCTSSNTSRQLQFLDTPSSSNALNTTSSPIVATCSPHPRMDPVRRSLGPLPMHLFTDIDEQYRFPKMT